MFEKFSGKSWKRILWLLRQIPEGGSVQFHYISLFFLGCILKVIVLPGGTVEKTSNQIASFLSSLYMTDSTTVKVLVAVGICDFTEKIYHVRGVELAYNRSSENLDRLLSTFNSQLPSFKATFPCKFQIIIATVPPANIKKIQRSSNGKKQIIFLILF